jgi:hypothetical protein
MARLVFLSGLRDVNSGSYRVPKPFHSSGARDDIFLRTMHEEAFSVWLDYEPEEQKADLDLCFSGLHCGKRVALQTWLSLESYRWFFPASATSVERRLFCGNLELLMHRMARESGVLSTKFEPRT